MNPTTHGRASSASPPTRTSTELVELALEISPSAMLLVDERGHVLLANSEAHRCLRSDAGTLVGKAIDSLLPELGLHSDSGAEDVQGLERVPYPTGEIREALLQRPDGSHVAVDLAFGSIQTQDGRFMLINVLDVTPHKRVEAELRTKTEDMEQLISIVSHDLRSPLVTIEGFAGMLGQHLEEHDIEKVTDDLHRIKRAAHTMAHLIRGLLMLSRASKQSLNLEAVDVRDVLEEVESNLDAALKQAGARLVLEVEPHTIESERNLLVQLFLNLVDNALKHGCPRPGGEIHVGYKRGDAEHVFSVADQGPGVDPTLQARMFQPFQRGRHEREGAGLGLAIVNKIAERHGGRAWVESAAGNGATFWVAVPRRTLPSASAP